MRNRWVDLILPATLHCPVLVASWLKIYRPEITTTEVVFMLGKTSKYSRIKGLSSRLQQGSLLEGCFRSELSGWSVEKKREITDMLYIEHLDYVWRWGAR